MASEAIQIIITGNAASATRSIQETRAGLAELEGQAVATGKASEAAGAKMAASFKAGAERAATAAKNLAVPIAAVGVAAGKLAIDFESAMTQIYTQAGATRQEMERLKQPVLDLAKASEFGPTALANALFRVESAGFRGAEAMGVLKVATEGAAVGHADLEQTAQALTAAVNSNIKGARNYTAAMATLNAAVGQGSMRLGDLVGALSTGVLPAARGVGLSLTDVTSALDVMTRAGVPAQAAATRLRMSFSLMAAPTTAAQTALKGIGLTQGELAHEMQGPGGLIGALQLLSDHLSGLSKVQQTQTISAAFGGGRSSSAIITLIQNLDTLQKVYDATGKQAGKFDQQLAAQSQTVEAQFKTAWASIQAALVELGQKIIPEVAPMVTHLVGILTDPSLTSQEKISTLISNISDTLGQFVPKAAALGIEITKSLVSGMLSGFAQSDTLGRIFEAAVFIRLIGGPGKLTALGLAIGRYIGGGIAAGEAATAAAGGAAAGGGAVAGAATGVEAGAGAGVLSRVSGIAGRLGAVGVAITAANEALDTFGQHAQQSSSDLNTAIEGFKKISSGEQVSQMFRDLGAITGHSPATDVFKQQQQAAELQTLVNGIADGETRLNQATLDHIRSLGSELGLTKQLSAALDEGTLAGGAFAREAAAAQGARHDIIALAKAGDVNTQTLIDMTKAAEANRQISHEAAAAQLADLRKIRTFQDQTFGRGQGLGIGAAIIADRKVTDDETHRIKNTLVALQGDAKRSFAQTTADLAAEWHQAGIINDKTFKAINQTITDDMGKSGKTIVNTAQSATQKASAALSALNKSAHGSLTNIGGTAYEVFTTLATNTDSLLQGFGAPPLKYHLTKANTKALAGSLQQQGLNPLPGLQRGGHIDMGAPWGDSVPALLERDEYVLNSEAVKRVGVGTLDRINFDMAPRFATGGAVSATPSAASLSPPNFGGHPSNVNSAVAQVISIMQSHFPLAVTATTDGTHVTGSMHYSGDAVDLAAASQVMFAASEFVKNSGLYRSITQGIHNPNLAIANGVIDTPPGPYGAVWAEHANHIHLGLTQLLGFAGGAAGPVAAAVAQKIARLIIEGPAGSGKDMLQGASDMVWKAANAYLAKQAPTAPAGATAPGPPGALPSVPSGSLSQPQIEALWSQVNSFGDAHLMSAIAEAESGGNPMSLGAAGDKGLYQIIPSTASAFGIDYGRLFDPSYNTFGAGKVLQGQGLSAWSTYNSGAYQSFMQLGGLVKALQAGGKVEMGGGIAAGILAATGPGAGHYGGSRDKWGGVRSIGASYFSDQIGNSNSNDLFDGGRYFAELGGGMGNLPEWYPLDVEYGGKAATAIKADVGPPYSDRDIDIHKSLASVIGFPSTVAPVKVGEAGSLIGGGGHGSSGGGGHGGGGSSSSGSGKLDEIYRQDFAVPDHDPNGPKSHISEYEAIKAALGYKGYGDKWISAVYEFDAGNYKWSVDVLDSSNNTWSEVLVDPDNANPYRESGSADHLSASQGKIDSAQKLPPPPSSSSSSGASGGSSAPSDFKPGNGGWPEVFAIWKALANGTYNKAGQADAHKRITELMNQLARQREKLTRKKVKKLSAQGTFPEIRQHIGDAQGLLNTALSNMDGYEAVMGLDDTAVPEDLAAAIAQWQGDINVNQTVADDMLGLRNQLVLGLQTADARHDLVVAELAHDGPLRTSFRDATREVSDLEDQISNTRDRGRKDLLKARLIKVKGRLSTISAEIDALAGGHGVHGVLADIGDFKSEIRGQGFGASAEGLDQLQGTTFQSDTVIGSLPPLLPGEIPAYGGDLLSEMIKLQGLGSSKPVASDAGASDTAASEALALQLQLAQETIRRQALELAQGPVFTDWLRQFAGAFPFVGAFQTGGVLPDTGYYLGHKGETVIPAGGGGHVTLVLQGKGSELVELVDARIDGKKIALSQFTDQTVGRNARRISFAPGR